MDVFGPDEAAAFPNNVVENDGDSCYDIVAGSGWELPSYTFRENLNIKCDDIGADENIDEGQVVALQTCYAWKTSGNGNDNCDTVGYAVPSGTSVS